MSNEQHASRHRQGDGPGIPSETFRGLASVAIVVYFIGVLLTVAGNSGSGSSAFVRTVKTRLFSPWMVPPWLDLGFDWHLTYGQLTDADHVLEVSKWAGGDAAETLRFPEAGVGGLRAARWRRLAARMEPEAVESDLESQLPTAVARGLFDRLAAEDLRIRSLRVVMPDRVDVKAAGASPPELEEAAAARVRRIAGSVQMLPLEQSRDVAPPVASPGSNRDRQGASP